MVTDPVNRISGTIADNMQWEVLYWVDERGNSPFATWYSKLDEYQQAVVTAVITRIIAKLGIDVCDTEFGKPLGMGLYEIRVRMSLEAIQCWRASHEEKPRGIPRSNRRVLLRIFCTFTGNKVVIFFQGYDKGKDPSARRQQREIARARKMLAQWRQSG